MAIVAAWLPRRADVPWSTAVIGARFALVTMVALVFVFAGPIGVFGLWAYGIL